MKGPKIKSRRIFNKIIVFYFWFVFLSGILLALNANNIDSLGLLQENESCRLRKDKVNYDNDNLKSNSVTKLTKIGQYDDNFGMGYELAVKDNFVFIANCKGGLTIFNISDYSNPIFISEFFDGQSAEEIFVYDNYVFLLDIYNGLEIIDITNPYSPSKIAQYENPSNGLFTDVWVKEDLVYLTDSYNGLIILDISDPKIPLEINQVDNCMYSIFIENDLAYFCIRSNNSFGLEIINISNSLNPQTINIIFKDVFEGFENLFVKNGIIFVPNRFHGLQIYNATNPEDPEYLGNYTSINRIFDVFVENNIAYLVGEDHSLQILDITNVSEIIELGHFTSLSNRLIDIYYENGFGIVLDFDGFYCMDLTDNSSPTEISHYNYNGYAMDISIKNEFAFIADGDSGLEIINVKSRYNPEEIATLNLWDYTYSVFIRGNYCFLANNEEGFSIVDIKDPYNPKVLVNVLCGEGIYSVYVTDYYVFLTDQRSDKIFIYDITTLTAPQLICELEVFNSVISAFVSSEYLFISSLVFGWAIYDISTINAPSLIWSSDFAYVVKILVVENIAYVPSGYSLFVYDISNIEEPLELDRYDSYCYDDLFVDLEIYGDYLYLANARSGIKIFDVSAPQEIELVASYEEITDWGNGIAIDYSYVYLADFYDGLEIFEIPNKLIPAPTGINFLWFVLGFIIFIPILAIINKTRKVN